MTNLSVSRLESQLLEQVTQVGQVNNGRTAMMDPTKRHMLQYAFRDFVAYFLELDQRAQAQARQNKPQVVNGVALTTTALHLNIQVTAYDVPEASNQGQPLSVHKYENDQGQARLIQLYSSRMNDDGTMSYQVTVIKLAVSLENVAPSPEVGQGSQVGQIPAAEAGGSAGDSLQDFLNRSPYSQTAGTAVWSYQTDDALDLLQEEERLQTWAQEQHMQELIEAAYKIIAYMNANDLEVAFNMDEQDKAIMMNALNNDPAEVAQAVLKSFIRKKRVELDMLRKEIKERQEIEEAKHKLEKVPPQFERILNFFDKVERMLDTQKFDKNALRNMMNALDQLNESLNKVLDPATISTPAA